jgi:hypothetical protein
VVFIFNKLNEGNIMILWLAVIIFFGLGFYLFVLRFRRSPYFTKDEMRSGKERRKSFVASKNQMRRSGKDRRI